MRSQTHLLTLNVPELVMVEFDNLPQTSRSLILTKLALEIVSADCRSILELARKRNQTIHEVWHEVCRKAALPLCEMPLHVIASSLHSPAATSVESVAAGPKKLEGVNTAAVSLLVKRASSSSSVAAAPKKSEVVNTVATPSLVKRAAPSSVPRGHRAQNWPVILAVGVGGIVVAGIALFTVVSTTSPQAITARPTEVVRSGVAKPGETTRTDAAKPSRDPVAVPPPQGTVNRMDAISKAFSKK
jgi:hypothetical protein